MSQSEGNLLTCSSNQLSDADPEVMKRFMLINVPKSKGKSEAMTPDYVLLGAPVPLRKAETQWIELVHSVANEASISPI